MKTKDIVRFVFTAHVGPKLILTKAVYINQDNVDPLTVQAEMNEIKQDLILAGVLGAEHAIVKRQGTRFVCNHRDCLAKWAVPRGWAEVA